MLYVQSIAKISIYNIYKNYENRMASAVGITTKPEIWHVFRSKKILRKFLGKMKNIEKERRQMYKYANFRENRTLRERAIDD